MSRITVILPDETTILSLRTVPLQELATDCDIPAAGIQEEILRKILCTVRSLFDGRQFNVSRSDLLRLQRIILPDLVVDETMKTPTLALNCARFFSNL